MIEKVENLCYNLPIKVMDILHFKVKNSGKNIFFSVEGGIFLCYNISGFATQP